MKIAINLIKVDEDLRIRKDIGDLQPLVDSIGKVGLINPILIDEQSNLVAGFRRLEACKKLKMEEVEVKIVEFSGDTLKMLDVEAAENFFRKDFTPAEILATARRRQEIIESTRKKSLWERIWLWFKSLFVPKPVSTNQGQKPTSGQPAPEKREPDREAGQQTDPQEGEKTHQNREDAGEEDPRIIKWRSS